MTETVFSWKPFTGCQEWSHGNILLKLNRVVVVICFVKQLPGDLSLHDLNQLAFTCAERKEKNVEQAERDGGEGNNERGPFFRNLKLRVAIGTWF